MEPEILRKLGTLLREGINSEPQAVYLMAAIRKLLEQQDAKDQYQYLNFHCDWALHSKLTGRAAQNVLKHFDEVNTHLRTGKDLHELPRRLQDEIGKLSKMEHFEDELETFLQANRLPPIDAARSDGWVYFLHFYASVISDCPLVIDARNAVARIRSVTVKVELASHAMHDETIFRVRWEVLDKNGLSGSLDIYNSFSLTPKVVGHP